MISTAGEPLPLHIDLIIFCCWALTLWGYKKWLDQRFGKARKTKYKKAWLGLFVGLSFIFAWLGMGADWIIFGIPGVISFVRALIQFARFAPKRIPDGIEREDTTFR